MPTMKKTATEKKATTAKKAAAPKKAAAAKSTAAKSATAVAEAPVAPTVAQKLAVAMMPEAPETALEMTAVVAKAAPAAPIAAPAAKREIVLTIGMLQKRLTELKAYDGAWDGVYGPMTKHAVARFQASRQLPVNGDATPETLAALGLDLYTTY